MSHKVKRLVYIATNVKVYHGLLSIMNEYGQVSGYWRVKTGSQEELRGSMMKRAERYRAFGFEMPAAVYTDRAPNDRKFLEDIWSSLNHRARTSNEHEHQVTRSQSSVEQASRDRQSVV